MKQQHTNRRPPQTVPQVIDQRRPELPPIDPATANLPLRTIIFTEVGNMEPAQVQLLVQSINSMYEGARGGIHYVIPIRHGKIGTDVVFEAEFLAVVEKVCLV